MTDLPRQQSTRTRSGELYTDEPLRRMFTPARQRVSSPAGAARARRRGYALAAVCSEQGRSCLASGSRCESRACSDVGCLALDEDKERVA